MQDVIQQDLHQHPIPDPQKSLHKTSSSTSRRVLPRSKRTSRSLIRPQPRLPSNSIQRALHPVLQLAPNRRRFSALRNENRPLLAALFEFEHSGLGEDVEGEVFETCGSEEPLDAVGGEAVVFDGLVHVGEGGVRLAVLILAVAVTVVVTVVMTTTTLAMRVRVRPMLERQEINNDQNPRFSLQPLGQPLNGQRRVFEVVEPKPYRCDVEIVEIWSAELRRYCGA